MIPLAIPNIGELEGTYLQQCVDTNFVSSVGPSLTNWKTELPNGTVVLKELLPARARRHCMLA